MVRADRVRGYLDGIVLALLVEGDSYGYEIAQAVNARTGGALSLKEGSLYPALKRLEAEDSIAGYWGTDKETGPRRRYYRLTARGRDRLEQIRREWAVEQQTLAVFLGKAAME